jgi:hypothetical protein
LKSIPETIDATLVHIALVFVTSTTDLFEISKSKAMNPGRRLKGHKLSKEMILAVENRRAINRGDFEFALMLGV